MTVLEHDGQPLAAIVHDPVLREDPALVGSVLAVLRLTVENERLDNEVQAGGRPSRSTLRRRLPRQADSAAYFTIAEALTNASRHARATRVTVGIAEHDGELALTVADDGIGGADASRGTGLRGLADRVAAVDGEFEVRSPTGGGTVVTARIPVPPS